MKLEDLEKQKESVEKEFGEAFKDDQQRFELYQDAQIYAIIGMICLDEDDNKEFKRLMIEKLKNYLNMKKIGD